MRMIDNMAALAENLLATQGRAGADQYGALPSLTPYQLYAMYRDDWLARKIVNIPAEDAFREWRTWSGIDGKDQTHIENAETALGVLQKCQKAQRLARWRGGSLLLIGDGASDPRLPLEPEKMKKGGIKYLHVFDREEVFYDDVQRDIADPWFGEPIMWQIPADNSRYVEIHPSRVIKFVGEVSEDPAFGISDGVWGDSVLQACHQQVKNVARICYAIAELIHDAKSDIIHVKELAEQVSTKKGMEAVLKRFDAAMLIKGINGAVILDEEENWEQKTYNFAGIPEVIEVMVKVVSGAADIPVERIADVSPGSLSDTGEGNIRHYYDGIASMQVIDLQPRITPLDVALKMHALGADPEDSHYEWNPLWQPSAKEKAETSTKKAATVSVYHRTKLIDPEALSRSVVTMVAEDGILPNIEQNVEDVAAEREAGILPPTPEEEELEELRKQKAEFQAANDPVGTNDPVEPVPGKKPQPPAESGTS